MAFSYRQSSFAGGEISPSLYGRTDLDRYGTALRRCRNFIPTQHGTLKNRSGTKYLGEVKDSTKKVRLIPFNYSDTQTYVLEFGNLYLRWWTSGGSLADPITPSIPYELATPYLEADLATLKFAQSGDVLTIVHQNYQPRELTRLGHQSWTLSLFSTVPSVGSPGSIADSSVAYSSDASHPERDWEVVVTSVNSNGIESVPDYILKFTKAAPYSDRPTVYTWAYLADAAYYRVYRGRAGVWGYVGQADQSSGIATGITFTDDGQYPDYATNPPTGRNPFPSSAWTANTSYRSGDVRTNGGKAYQCITSGISAASGGPSGTGSSITDGATASWASLQGYTAGNRIIADGATWEAAATGTSGSGTPDWRAYVEPITDASVGWYFIGYGGAAIWKYLGTATSAYYQWPASVAYYQQRLMFCRTNMEPQTVWLSRTGDFHNFDTSVVIRDDDSIKVTLASMRLEEIRGLLPSPRGMLIVSASSEWTLAGTQDGPLTPTSLTATAHAHRGSSWLDPIGIGNAAVYVQSKSSLVRDIVWNWQVANFDGQELTLLARHLVDGYVISDWCYAEQPFSLIYCIRDDGVLLTLTYLRDQQVWAWAWHDTDGLFENVCTVPEGTEDAVYVVVKRTIGGVTKRYVERFTTRFIDAVEDATFLDCSITRTGAATTSITGLSHLEGKTVTALADGNVVPDLVVSGGAVTLSAAASKVQVGLAYTPEIELLDVALKQTEVHTRDKNIGRVSFEVEASRGLWVGQDFDHLSEWKQRVPADAWGSIPLFTGQAEVQIRGSYNKYGRAVVRQVDPLPCNILAVLREADIGG